MAKETIGAIFLKLISGGALLEAIIVLLSFDCFLREQDWEQLRTEDVQDTGDVMALLFGRAERGERSKTGQGQGLLVDYPGTREMLRARLSQVSPGDKIFKISQRTYRQLWHAAATKMGISSLVGRPHNVRHTGPSRDVYIRYRYLRGVQRRGRWRFDASVLRYAKTHEYARALARAPPALMSKGLDHLTALGERTETPLS